MSAAGALPVGSTIGILGGGQLARMLAMAAARLGYRTVVLDPAEPCPAAQVCNEQVVAAYDDPEGLVVLAEKADVVTYEFENVPDRSAALLGDRRPLRPSAKALGVSQDRLAEKEFIRSIGLSTAPFVRVDEQADVPAAIEELGGRVILKARRLGYDGKGQLRLEDGDPQIGDAFAQLGSVPLVAEGFIEFEREISVIAARSVDGDVVCFEPAHNTHGDGILRTSTVPAGVSDDVAADAVAAATLLATALDYVGVLGLELFVSADGSLLVNEFAPRVHNSGHWTELACVTDQFEQHIRAVCGLPLGDPTARPAEMINLIGDDVDRVPELVADGSWRVHLYGKSETRPGRKMGHATRLT